MAVVVFMPFRYAPSNLSKYTALRQQSCLQLFKQMNGRYSQENEEDEECEQNQMYFRILNVCLCEAVQHVGSEQTTRLQRKPDVQADGTTIATYCGSKQY